MREDVRVQRERLEDLIGVRLLIAPENGLLHSRIKADLKDWFEAGDFEAMLDEALESLVRAGRVERPGRRHLRLMPSGREAALRFLRVPSLPEKLAWAKLKSTYLIARALELPPPLSPKALQRIGTVGGLRAAILRRHYQLPLDDYPTAIQARDALAWRSLGRETSEPFNATRVQAWALSQELPEPVSKPNDAVNRIAIARIGARNAKPVELRNATVRRWVRGGAAVAGQPLDGDGSGEAAVREPVSHDAPSREADSDHPAPGISTPVGVVSLEEFAQKVEETARHCTSGRFGDDKVFISHVWRNLQPELRRDGAELFKRRLAEANRIGLLSLSRADLVQAMDPEDVRESEMEYLNARFHFVRVR